MEEVGGPADLALIGLGWVRGALNDYDDETMDYFLDEAKDVGNMIAALTNLSLALLDHHRQVTGVDAVTTLNEVSVKLNLMPNYE